MDLQARKYEFIRKLIKIEKPSIMDKLEKIIKKENLAERETLEDYNKDIDEAIAEIENGDFYTQEEIEKMAKEW